MAHSLRGAGNTRPAAVAGAFYPGDRAQLRRDLEHYLAAPAPSLPAWSATSAESHPSVLALIVPHAGYPYSGPVAARAYQLLQTPALARRIDQIILLGPSHHVPLRGVASCGFEQLRTPLGTVAVDTALRRLAEEQPGVVRNDLAHLPEHSLEVQLPFVQYLLPNRSVLPLLIGAGDPEAVADLLTRLVRQQPRGSTSLLLVSSDMSHYHPYAEACAQDRASADLIVRRTPVLQGEQACGCHAVNGLLALSNRWQLNVELLDLRNSGDTAGRKDRVVGYAAFLAH